ncbi:MAG: hypothetical protein MRY67_13095 [Rhodovulum sp.]|jgi:hypothetical protein|nr:hypothetical protein [Rhodovulum sp.]
MMKEDLAQKLKERYSSAGKGETALAIHLFGIEFADELAGQPINEIAELGTGHVSYGTEIRKGMRLARYVMLKG